ncbi:hypothetical protein [Streptoalloteichus tenebrarius]|uniref:hypothetical protein n=1 Tax=Streptoalloteichus tenebrarius (strain ATCC 17920 / DSM 40477 / JCM 4838 / CBS 697.72 / NBRC 16177 / NCIMB 11028 / NRRL B-12390 / A12253. 1 / ISP 5477) TaxID=1933 RepID=UPI0020A39D8B|nr:hypothetical protein [Streptoalloteichus tenebrarius]
MSTPEFELNLPPGVVAETFTYRNGRTTTIYRAPFPSEGPVRGLWEGYEALLFMYAHFVFVWPKAAGQVEVRHGTLTKSLLLWPNVPIEGQWCAETLRLFGVRWTRDHLAKFRL